MNAEFLKKPLFTIGSFQVTILIVVLVIVVWFVLFSGKFLKK